MSNLIALHDHLFAYASAADPQERARIEVEVWKRCRAEGAIFILDMAGFSKSTQRHGIVYYLAMVRRMQLMVEPLIERHGGRIVKFEADNCFAWFSEVEDAIEAAIGVNLAAAEDNQARSGDLPIVLACGIDYGEFLLIDDRDFFGDPVNRACKLGEDIAGDGEILITKQAMNRVKSARKFAAEEVQFNISRISIDAFRLIY